MELLLTNQKETRISKNQKDIIIDTFKNFIRQSLNAIIIPLKQAFYIKNVSLTAL